MSGGDISFDTLAEQAHAATGLDDFGPGEFRANATLLIEDAARSDATPAGMALLAGRIARQLENRLQIVRDRKAHPEIAAQTIAAPIIVMGLPRSGTTFLHSLLAQDPALRSPLQWEVSRPSPPPRAETFHSDPRIALSRAEMAGDSETQRLHMQDAELPVECGPVFAAEFMNTGNFAFWDAPVYLARIMGRDGNSPILAAYEYHRRMLQHLQAFAPRERWVLKSPQHIMNLGELLAIYPDATLVFTHRDPVETIPSLASLVAHFRARAYDRPDLAKIGGDVNRLWKEAMNRCMAWRASHPAVAARCIDIPYRQLVTEPLAVMEQIHAAAGLDFGRARPAAAAWIAANRQDRYRSRHGRHDYSAEKFGLRPQDIAEAFTEYRDEYEGAKSGAAQETSEP